MIIIGAGIAGMATALRLQTRGCSTLLLESHSLPGGCAGYFRRRGFCFDVGATTLVDFSPGGVGGRFLHDVGIEYLDGELLPAYQVWLPDRTVTLYHDAEQWNDERLRMLGSSAAHRHFWEFMDRVGETFWGAARAGVKLPIRNASDLLRAARCVPPTRWALSRHLFSTMGQALQAHGLENDLPVRGLMRALLEDTVHAPVETAPLINGALGISIRGAGLTRARGGMRGLFQRLTERYAALGGTLRTSTPVERVSRCSGFGTGFYVRTSVGDFHGAQVVSTLPVWNTAKLGMPDVTAALEKYLRRDESSLGSAAVVFLGVPEGEIAGRDYTHHQVLRDYKAPLGSGNNMFISVSAPGDLRSAPAGHRAVMLSTHTDLEPWEALPPSLYEERKAQLAELLLSGARRVYPELGRSAIVQEVATPRTYERYTRRHRGAVGGVCLSLGNSNQFAVPQDLGVPGFWQAGDTTWPGLGTVACLLGSSHAADGVWKALNTRSRRKSASVSGRVGNLDTPERQT